LSALRHVKKQVVTRILLVILGLGIAEGALAVLGYPPRQPQTGVILLPWIESDPFLGWRNRPGDYPGQFEDLSLAVTINDMGTRTQRPPNVVVGNRRVEVLGDSYVFGIGVSDDQTLSASLSRNLPSVDFINRGVPGYGTTHVMLQVCSQSTSLRPVLLYLFNSFHEARNVDLGAIASSLLTDHAKVPIVAPDGGGFKVQRVPIPKRPDQQGLLRLSHIPSDLFQNGMSLYRQRHMRPATLWAIDELARCAAERSAILIVALGDGETVVLKRMASHLTSRQIRHVVTSLPSVGRSGRTADGHPNAETLASLATEIAPAIQDALQ
jgi:hypothetical protein